MPVHIETRQAGAGIILDCSGSLTLSDFREVQNEFLTCPEKLKQLKYVIPRRHLRLKTPRSCLFLARTFSIFAASIPTWR